MKRLRERLARNEESRGGSHDLESPGEDEESASLLEKDSALHSSAGKNRGGTRIRMLIERLVSRPRRLKAGILLLCILVSLSDPHFMFYAVCLNVAITIIVSTFCWPCHAVRLRYTLWSMLPVFLGVFSLFAFLSKMEVAHKREFSFDLSNVNKTKMFYYMEPALADYSQTISQHIGAISDFVNGGPASSQRIEHVPVFNVKLFDNAIRFDFLLEYLRNDEFTSDFACLIETDVVVRLDYFEKRLKRQKPDFSHIQHHWGHRDFESQNVGVLCARKKADHRLHLWLRWMSYLNNRRYCRLLIKPLLYAMAPNRMVFYWDQDGGCTRLRPYCNYIHFTSPKSAGLKQAMDIIRQGHYSNSYT